VCKGRNGSGMAFIDYRLDSSHIREINHCLV
jgi:hypothetical protein